MMILGSKLSSLVAWGMLPLLLLGGMPNTSCICADGQRKLFCPKLWGGKNANDASCCRGNCCMAATPTEDAVASCCHKANARPGSDETGRNVSSQPCCCHPEHVEPAVNPSTPVKSLLADLALALQPLVCETNVVVCSRNAAHAFSGGSGPPTDLVISLQRFLI